MSEDRLSLAAWATALYPVRISALNTLARCPAAMLLSDDRLVTEARESSTAADTGTACGRVIELYHAGLDFAAAFEQTAAEADGSGGGRPFVLADLERVGQLTAAYCSDPRNPQDVVRPESLEAEVRLELPAAPEDLTGRPVVFVGHLDQIRETERGPEVWDVKAGKPGGLDMLFGYAWQLTAYAMASTQTYGEPIGVGGIVRLMSYRTRDKRDPGDCNVFYKAAWTMDHAADMLATAVQLIAELRAGRVMTFPGLHCSWCSAGSPHLCGDRVENLKLKETNR